MTKRNNKQLTSSYQAALLEALKNPDEAEAYLNIALEEYEQDRD